MKTVQMDLTPAISQLLVQAHSSKPISFPRLADSLDPFLKEATQINKSISSLLSYLRSIRQPYLSSSAPPRRSHKPSRKASIAAGVEVPSHLDDTQREAIDSQTSSVLREINGNITNLSSAVSLQHDTATKVLEKKYGKPTGLLWRWTGGDGDAPDAGKSKKQLDEEGRVKTTKEWREGVLWYLNKKLETAVSSQQEMVEIRLERERQRQMSVLYDQRNKNVRLEREPETVNGEYGNIDLRGHDKYNPAPDQYHESGGQELSPEQMQLFEQENSALFNHLNDQLAKVTQAEKSLMEIGSLQQTLVGHLSVQGEMIGQLVDDAADTEGNVKRGNKELKKASERGSTAKMVCWASAGLCSFLIVWDLIF